MKKRLRPKPDGRASLYVAQDGVAHALRQRPQMGSARFGAADPKHGILPVQIVQSQPADFSGPQPVPDEQHQDCPVALVDRTITLNRRQQAHDILAPQPFRHGLVGHEPGRHDPFGKPRPAPAARLGEQEERPQTLRVIVSRPAAPGASPVLFRYGIVDVGHPDVNQRRASSLQPQEEAVGGPAIVLYGRRGETAFLAQPPLEGADLGVMRMATVVGLIEPAQKGQPSKTVVDEVAARLGRCCPVAPTPFRLRPCCSRSLDLRPAYPVAIFQVQKAHQAQLIVGALPQRRSSCACLLEMNEVSFPLLRRAALLDTSRQFRGKKISSNIVGPPCCWRLKLLARGVASGSYVDRSAQSSASEHPSCGASWAHNSVPQRLGAEPAQVLVEVAERGRERQRLDPGRPCSLGQDFYRTMSCGIVVSREIEPIASRQADRSAARWLAESAAAIGIEGMICRSERIVSSPSPAIMT